MTTLKEFTAVDSFFFLQEVKNIDKKTEIICR